MRKENFYKIYEAYQSKCTKKESIFNDDTPSLSLKSCINYSIEKTNSIIF